MGVGGARGVGLLAVAVFVALTHVCTGPLHVHAGPTHSHDGSGTPDGHEESRDHDGGDALHVASCEAVRTAAVSLPPAPPALAVEARTGPLVTARCRAVEAREVQPFGASPPLFLLHAALLI